MTPPIAAGAIGYAVGDIVPLGVVEDMSNRSDAVANHEAHERLAATEERVRGLDLNAVPEAEEHGQRIREVVRYARAKTTEADPCLLSPAMLDRLVPQLEGLDSRLGQFEADPNPSWLQQAAPFCDGLLDAVAPIPPPTPDEELRVSRAAASELRTHFAEILQELRSGQDAVVEEAASISTQLGEAKTTSDAEVAAVKAEVGALRTLIGEQTDRLDAALAAFQTDSASRVSTVCTGFETTNQDLLASAKAAADTALSEFEVSTVTATTEFTERAEASVAKLEELRDEAAKLVGVVSGNATAGGFKKVADEEHKSADHWRKVSVVSVMAVVGVGIWILVAVAGQADFGWDRVAVKLLVSGPLGVLAAYAGRQSAGHRKTERRARNVQLQLAALGPYVESLPDDEAAKVRAELASYVFGPPPDEAGKSDDEVITGPALVSLLEKALSGSAKR